MWRAIYVRALLRGIGVIIIIVVNFIIFYYLQKAKRLIQERQSLEFYSIVQGEWHEL